MDRVNYLFYQLFLKIKYEKRRYFLYVLSFYVGLLLPTCCIANTRSVEQVIYYTTFKGMEDSFQVDWLSRTFNTIKLDKEISYSISAFYEESFPEWENQYVSIKGIDESYFYPLPKIEGRTFSKKELQEGKDVCLMNKQYARMHACEIGDMIQIRDKRLKVIGLIDNSVYSGMIIPYQTNGLQDIMNCEMNPIPQLEKKQMPTKIAELNWKTETDEIKLKKCVVAPITYMEQYKEEISSAAIHVEWKKKYLKNEEKTIQKIETYLYNSHDQSFRYRIYSPEIELRNNTIKVMTSLQAINKVALLFMAVFLTGMIAIYQLRFEHREESYGISLAYGAQYKELYWEIFCEILLLNSIGTIIGIVIGYLVTYYVDFGIMISVVNVQGSWYTFLSAYGLCVVLSSFVSVITFRKLKKKKIIELLNVY